MANVDITKDDFASSKVVPVCVFTGVPAAEMFAFRFRDANGGKVAGGLPVDRNALGNLTRLRRLILTVALSAVIALGVTLVSGSPAAALLAVGLMAVATVTAFVAKRRLVNGFICGDRVMLHNVHPAFAKAVENPSFGKCSACPTLADCPNAHR